MRRPHVRPDTPASLTNHPMLGTLVSFAAGFAGSGVLALLLGRRSERALPLLIAALAFVGAVLAATLADASPTGVGAADAVLRGLLVAVTVVAASRANPWMVVAATVVASLASADARWELLPFAALGLAAAVALSASRSPAIQAVAGGAVGLAVLELGHPAPVGRSALFAAASMLLLVAGTLTAMPARPRRRALSMAKGFALAAAAVTLPAVYATVLARPKLLSAVDLTEEGHAAARLGDQAGARAKLRAAADRFGDADALVGAWWARGVDLVPGVAHNLRALRGMAATGEDLATAGATSLTEIDLGAIHMEDGHVPVDKVAALASPLREAIAALAQAEAQLDLLPNPWLLRPAEKRLDALTERVHQARDDAEVVLAAAQAAPTFLGRNGPRRYFVAMQNPAEARGSGGIVGNFGEVLADNGALSLTRVGRDSDLNEGGTPDERTITAPEDYVQRYGRFQPAQTWQNVTLSPDFPSVGQVISELYPQSGGRPVDGVISIDPVGLAAVLRLTGPVAVPGLAEPLTEENAAQVLLHDQYALFPDNTDRIDFLGVATETVWNRLTTGRLPSPPKLGEVLGPVVRAKHIMLWSREGDEQQLFRLLGVDGGMEPVFGDYLGVVNQNAGGNKLDWFLERSLAYEVNLDPSSGELRSRLRVKLRNTAPASGQPPIVINDLSGTGVPPGTNRTYLSVYTPWALAGASIDGRELFLESAEERGRLVYSTFLLTA